MNVLQTCPTTSPVGSAVLSSVPEAPPSVSACPAYLGDQLGSFLFSQIHWLLRSATVDVSFFFLIYGDISQALVINAGSESRIFLLHEEEIRLLERKRGG